MRRQAKGGRRQAAGGGLRRRRNSDYYGSHRPGGPEFGATMDNVEWAMPDFYTHPEWYYHGGAADRARDRSGARVIIGTRGNPSKAVRIYRAVPRDVDTINPGDWVTQTRAYAKLHLDSVLNGDGHILSTMARAGELYNTGDSLHEWGWHPAKAENPRRKNPAGRLLQFPLREIRVEAFPSPLSSGWLLRLHINGQDVKDAVRDIRTGQARVFDSSAKAAAWWKKHGQAFVDAMGRAACVRTRKANRPGGRRQAAGGRHGNPAGSPFAAEVARLRSDPTLQSASMRQHLRNVAKAPGSGRPRRSAAAREWKEFAGYEPNHVEKIDGVSLKGNLPGVRVDVLEGVGAETGRRVKIDAGQKPLYLVWFKSGERFAVTGGPSAMRELARDFSRLNEPIYLTKVDYVAPRYPVPEGVRRTKANAELSIAFTHAVENPTLMTWNGKLDPKHARFDIRVKGRRRRWVNRSGLIF